MNAGPLLPQTRSFWRLPWDFWVRPVRAEPLALFRILIGSCLLASLLTDFLPRLALDLGPDGLSQAPALGDWLETSGRFSLLRGPTNLPYPAFPYLEQWTPPAWADAWRDWADQPRNAFLLAIVWVLAVALMTVGLGTRTATVVAWALTVSFHVRLPWTLNGGDSLFRCALFYLMFARSGAVWSLDARWFRREGTVPAWPVRLMQIQLCVMYLFTGLYKIGSDWKTGEAIYWVLNDIELTRWPYFRFPIPLVVCRVLSWGTLAFEIGFPLLVLSRWTRPWILLVGVTFHLGILATLEIGWFSQVCLCWYVLFLSGNTLVRLLRRCTSRFPLRYTARSPA